MRSYGEYCALAKSLDVVGDRWKLLIVRELMLRGACRYTDLRNGLPGIATNLLADRLRELEQAGIVSREDAPPPIATALFRLTPRGEQLRPVVEDLTRWGVPLMVTQNDEDAVRSHWLAFAVELMLSDHAPEAPLSTIELRTGDQTIAVEAEGGAIRAHLRPVRDPDAALTGPPRAVMGVLLGLLELTAAEGLGVSFEGDPAALARIREPAVAAPAG